jgi:hypothetical protein
MKFGILFVRKLGELILPPSCVGAMARKFVTLLNFAVMAMQL